jgi:hypothetical protein
MAAAFLTSLRQCRRPIATIAVGLVVLQTLLAGLMVAQAAALAVNPFAVICHTTPATDAGDGTAPDGGKVAPVCCIACTATGPALPPGQLPAMTQFDLEQASGPAMLSRITIAIDPRAVRAGSSQAPPRSST